MKKRRLNNLPELKEKRQELRNNATSAEAVLWGYLKKSQLEGRKFRRQHSIGKYVVDFYCPKERLAVELDGVYHFTEEGIKHDSKKTDFLNSPGIRVLRFENEKVFENIDAVLETIRLHFK
jgi:very-short-patch-repair endonuclease